MFQCIYFVFLHVFYVFILYFCGAGKTQIKWMGQLAMRWAYKFVLHGDGKHKLHCGEWVLLSLGTHVLTCGKHVFIQYSVCILMFFSVFCQY